MKEGNFDSITRPGPQYPTGGEGYADDAEGNQLTPVNRPLIDQGGGTPTPEESTGNITTQLFLQRKPRLGPPITRGFGSGGSTTSETTVFQDYSTDLPGPKPRSIRVHRPYLEDR